MCDARPLGSFLSGRGGLFHLFEREGKPVLVASTYESGGETVSLGRTDWADWDGNSDLLYAKDGKMFRLSPGKGGRFDPAESREIADFNGDRFQAIPHIRKRTGRDHRQCIVEISAASFQSP